VAGIVAAIYPFAHPDYGEKYFDSWAEFLVVLLVCLFYFLCVWVAIRAVAWIITGFISDRSGSPE
jgi:hypothetical protein